ERRLVTEHRRPHREMTGDAACHERPEVDAVEPARRRRPLAQASCGERSAPESSYGGGEVGAEAAELLELRHAAVAQEEPAARQRRAGDDDWTVLARAI